MKRRLVGSAGTIRNTPGRAGYGFTLGDVAFLTSTAGFQALEQAAGLDFGDSRFLADLTRTRRFAGVHAAAVAETVLLRRRASIKLGSAAGSWLFTESALQQATPLRVARHRAARLAGVGVHDLTCSIGADLHVLARSPGPVIGSDLDPIRLAMAAHNLAVAGLPVRLVRADALTVTSSLLGYADPARRDAAGRRITSADTVPPVADLDRVHRARPAVLRLPPGMDFDTVAPPGSGMEIELVSLTGVVREAVRWPAELAGPARRASVFRELDGSMAFEQIDSDDPDDCPVGVLSLIIEPDPAVIRAGLVRHWAARHGLCQLDPQLAYLSGDTAPPGVRSFRVLDQAPFTDKIVAGWIRRDAVGTLEIKQRGTSVVPDELRMRLRPALTGDRARDATVILARIGSLERAFWCRAQPAVRADAAKPGADR